MRDCRNVLHARLAVARKKQKQNCDGVVRANFQGVSDAQKRAGTTGPVPSRKGPRPPLFFDQTMSGSDAIRNSYPTYDPRRTVVGFVLFGKDKHELLWSTW
jgi:hypothetical protein